MPKSNEYIQNLIAKKEDKVNTEILRIEHLSKKYGKIQALDDVSLIVTKGQVLGILGPNGSGKTTTLGILLGVLRPNEGSYTWFEDKYGEYYKKKIGSMLETPNFYPYLNAVDNLEITALVKGVKTDNLDEILTTVGLYERKKSKFKTYSLGMKQRLSIAATLLGNPEVLLFDEPTNGLDPQGIAEIREVIIKLRDQGKTIIMASHYLPEVEKICSHIAILKKGKLLASGAIGQILSDDNIVELSSDHLEDLKVWINSRDEMKINHIQKEIIECSVNNLISASQINEWAHAEGIVLSRLVLRKRLLEEEFIQITQ